MLKVSTVTGAIHFNQVIMVIFFSFVSLSSLCQIYAVILIWWPRALTPAWNSPQRFVSVRPSLSEGWFHSVFWSEGQTAHCSATPMIFVLCCCFFSPKSPQNGGGKHKKQSLLPFTVIADKQHFPLFLLAERYSGILLMHELEGGPSNFPIQWYWFKSLLFVLYSAVEEQL